MSGFADNLSEHQASALAEFRESTANAPDDHTLLRFLRARAFNVSAASKLYSAFVKHRKAARPQRVLNGRVPRRDEFEDLVPHSFHGFDKEGRPLYIEKTGAINYPVVFKHLTNQDLMRHHVYQMEHELARCAESSERLGRYVENLCNIVDLAGLNMGHRKALTYIRLCAAHDQAYYPERMGKLFIINAPMVFPWFWRVCKRWIDERTESKIQVLGSNFKEELLKHIDADQLPEEYGGTAPNVEVRDISAYLKGPDLEPYLSHPDADEHTIGARSTWEVRLEAPEEGGTFEWTFACSSKDVQFSVEVVQGGDEADLSSDDEDAGAADADQDVTNYIVTPERVSMHRDQYTCHCRTTILLRFDNSYSRFTSKHIRLLTDISPLPEDELPEDFVAAASSDSDEGKAEDDEEDATPEPQLAA